MFDFLVIKNSFFGFCCKPLILLSLSLFIAPTIVFVKAEVLDRVIASIDGEPVTRQEIIDIGKLTLPESVDQLSFIIDEGSGELPEAFIKDSITMLLFEREAKQRNISIGQEEVEAYISEVEASNQVEKVDLINALEEKGISYETYVQRIKSDLLKSKVITSVISPRIQITDEEINDYLGLDKDIDESKQKKKDDGFILVRVLINNLNKASFSSKREALSEISKKMKSEGSCDFVKLYGGVCNVIGSVNLDDLKDDLRQDLLKRTFYEPSAIFELEGEPFFYLKTPVDSSKKPKTKVEQQVREKLFREKFREEAEKYLTEDLFKQYKVEIH